MNPGWNGQVNERKNLSRLIDLAHEATSELFKNLQHLEPKDFIVTGEYLDKEGNMVVIPHNSNGPDRVIFDLADFRYLGLLAMEDFELTIIDEDMDMNSATKLKAYLKALLIVEENIQIRAQMIEMFEDVVLQIATWTRAL